MSDDVEKAVADAREAAAGGGVEVKLELEISGFVKVKMPLSRARDLNNRLNNNNVDLADEDCGIDWVQAINELDGFIVDLEFDDPGDDEAGDGEKDIEVDSSAKAPDDD